MKKIGKYLLFVLVLFFGFFVSVNAEEKIEIKSINCDNMYNGELRRNVGVEINGLTIKVDDSYFYKAGDYFKCTLVVKNNADDDVTVDSESISNKSDENITFELKTEGENIIKKGEEKTYNLEINYIKAVEEDRTLENAVEIKLLNDEVKVPDTNVFVVLTISFVLLLIISIGIVIYTKKSAVLMLPIVFALLVVPAGYSLMKISIKLENKIYVEVDPRYKVIYNYETYLKDGEENSYANASKTENSCLTINDEEYCRYDVSTIEGYYKPGDTVEVKDMPRVYLDCAVTPPTNEQKFSYEDKTVLKKMSNSQWQCPEYKLVESTVNESDNWLYSKYDNNDDLIEFTGESVNCYEDGGFVKSYSDRYVIKRLASNDTKCSFTASTTFVMPMHDVNLKTTSRR